MRKALVSAAALGLLSLTAVPPAHATIATPPTDFSYQVLTQDVYDPMVVSVAPDGRVIVGQRDGKIKIWHQDGMLNTAVQLPVNAARGCVDCAETINDDGGIYGMALDPHFAKNGYLYLWYNRAHTGNPKTNLEEWWLSRLTLTPKDTIARSSEKVLFRGKSWYLDPEGSQAHYGGVLEFLPDGTLVLGTGDEVDPKCDGGYGPRDNTPAKGHFCNAEMTVQNPSSPWGKLLRFNTDGSVPDGRTKGVRANPFIGKKLVNPYIPDGRNHLMNYYVATRPAHPKAIPFLPQIYALGFKQPWRGAVDPKTGTLFLGDVGADAQYNDPQKGTASMEELDAVPYGGGGNYGWPRCQGNGVYHDYDWQNSVDHGPLDCSRMVPPLIYYTDSNPMSWPVVGGGPKTNQATLIYQASKGSLALPSRFFSHLIYTDWSRNFMYGIPEANGKLNLNDTQWELIRPGIPSGTFVGLPVAPPTSASNLATLMAPIDADQGRDGAYYFVEYGGGYGNNPLSRLSRFICTGCKANPAKDFVHTPGVPLVTAAQAFNPAPVTAAPLHAAPVASTTVLTAPRVAGGVVALALFGLGWRRRRVAA